MLAPGEGKMSKNLIFIQIPAVQKYKIYKKNCYMHICRSKKAKDWIKEIVANLVRSSLAEN